MRNLWRPLLRYLSKERPDALLATMWPLTGIASVAARASGSPLRVVASEHTDFRRTNNLKAWERRCLGLFGRAIYARCDEVVAVSEGVADSLAQCAGLERARIQVVANPVRACSEGEVLIGDESLIEWWRLARHQLLAIGSLKPAKDYDALLRSIASLKHRISARLIILGDGPLRSELEGRIAELGLSDSVRLPGFRANPYPFLSCAGALVLSSAWEGLPTVLIEALSVGIPVVSTNCRSGPAEILGDGRYGRLVPVGDTEALALAIEATLSECHDREALKQRAAEFGAARAVDAYMRLLVGPAPMVPAAWCINLVPNERHVP